MYYIYISYYFLESEKHIFFIFNFIKKLLIIIIFFNLTKNNYKFKIDNS